MSFGAKDIIVGESVIPLHTSTHTPYASHILPDLAVPDQATCVAYTQAPLIITVLFKHY